MSNSRSALAGVMVLAAVGALSSAPIAARSDATTARNSVTAWQPGQQQKAQAPKGAADRRTSRVYISGGSFGHGHNRRAGYGWTNCHQQRVAVKSRNVKHHRQAGR